MHARSEQLQPIMQVRALTTQWLSQLRVIFLHQLLHILAKAGNEIYLTEKDLHAVYCQIYTFEAGENSTTQQDGQGAPIAKCVLSA